MCLLNKIESPKGGAKECLHKKDSENEHLKSKIVDFTTVQNLRAQVKELQSENEHLKSKVVDFITFQNLQVQVEELKSENEGLTFSVQKLTKARERGKANLKQRDEKIYALSKKLRLLEEQSEEMGDKIKCFDDKKKVFETKILKLELAQRIKNFDDVKTELSRRTDKFEMYFSNLEKENALLKSQLASQNYTSLQKENNDLRTSYNVLKEKHETSCEKLEKENNDLKMHYNRLFDSIKQKEVDSQVFTKSIRKMNVSEKIYTGKFSKPISRKVSQLTTYSLQKDKKYLKRQHSSETFASQNHVKNESSKQVWKSKENISKRFKYSRNKMFSMRKRDDSVLKKVKDVSFPFISKRVFQSETPRFNNKWIYSSSSKVKTSNETPGFRTVLTPLKSFKTPNETSSFYNSKWKNEKSFKSLMIPNLLGIQLLCIKLTQLTFGSPNMDGRPRGLVDEGTEGPINLGPERPQFSRICHKMRRIGLKDSNFGSALCLPEQHEA
ncbi:hypothetical protein Tco_1532086 [Tanacetum coccineum]